MFINIVANVFYEFSWNLNFCQLAGQIIIGGIFNFGSYPDLMSCFMENNKKKYSLFVEELMTKL